MYSCAEWMPRMCWWMIAHSNSCHWPETSQESSSNSLELRAFCWCTSPKPSWTLDRGIAIKSASLAVFLLFCLSFISSQERNFSKHLQGIHLPTYHQPSKMMGQTVEAGSLSLTRLFFLKICSWAMTKARSVVEVLGASGKILPVSKFYSALLSVERLFEL